MSESDVTTYQNNLTYRCQIQLIEESFPQRANDPEVESVSSYRNVRRNSQTMKDSEISEIQKKETLSEALKDIKKAQTRRSIYNSLNQSQIQTPLKVNYLSPITRKITQQLIDQSEINTISHIEEQEQKVVPIRLMRILKMLTNNTRIFNKLSLQQHTLVGDIVSVYQKNKLTTNLTNSTRFSKFVSNVLNYTNLITQIFKLPIFAPSSKFIRIWDSMISILILFSTLLLNLQLFFTMPIEQFSSLFQLLFAFSIIDIFIELNTGIVQKGNVNFNRDFILKTYCKKTLIFDIFGNIPLFSFMINMEIGMKFQIFINILFIFKWIKIQKIFKWLSFYISYEKNNKNVFDLIRLLFFIIGVCHVFCLFWHGLALFEINNGKVDTWIHQKNLILSSIYERYTYSFYFLAVTMITVGYGDITPQNPLEILFTTCTIFITCIVYAFSLNTIGSIIENIEKKDKKYKENMQIIHGLMRDENVSRELRIKVSNYIEYLYKVVLLFYLILKIL